MKKIILLVAAIAIVTGAMYVRANHWNGVEPTPPNPIPPGGWLNPDPTYNYALFQVDGQGKIILSSMPKCDFTRPKDMDQLFGADSFTIYLNSKTHQYCKI